MKSLLLKLFLCFIAGGLLALSYPSAMLPGWLPLIFIAFPLFLWQLEGSRRLRESALLVLGFNLGLNVVGYYWIPHTLREFGHLPWIVSVVLGALFSLILQPHWWVYIIWKKYRPQWRWTSEQGILVTALLITILERFVPQQFPSFAGSPWLHMAPYLGLAPYFGVVAFSFITYWLSLEVISQLQMKKLRPQVWITTLVFVLANALFPLTLPAPQDKIAVRVVQANVGNFMKIASERGEAGSIESINDRYFRLSVTENGFQPELIVWPETAYPDTFSGNETPIPSIFRRIQEKTGAEILIGGYDQNPTSNPFDYNETVYNSSILMGQEGIKSSYHKNILIPFGETLPFGPFNAHIVNIVPAVSLFARGEGTPQMTTMRGHQFITPICYEILESNYMRGLLNQWGQSDFIVNHTNDSWYGDTAEPHQHLFLSKWRALEFNLPIVRSTNTGITSVIYPDGSESRRLGVGEEGILDVEVPITKAPATWYQRFGIYPLLLIFALLFGATWWRERN